MVLTSVSVGRIHMRTDVLTLDCPLRFASGNPICILSWNVRDSSRPWGLYFSLSPVSE